MGNIFSTNVDIIDSDNIDFDIINFAGEDDWGLDEPAPYFDLAVGLYLEAGVHYGDYRIAGYNIEHRVRG